MWYSAGYIKNWRAFLKKVLNQLHRINNSLLIHTEIQLFTLLLKYLTIIFHLPNSWDTTVFCFEMEINFGLDPFWMH